MSSLPCRQTWRYVLTQAFVTAGGLVAFELGQTTSKNRTVAIQYLQVYMHGCSYWRCMCQCLAYNAAIVVLAT